MGFPSINIRSPKCNLLVYDVRKTINVQQNQKQQCQQRSQSCVTNYKADWKEGKKSAQFGSFRYKNKKKEKKWYFLP